MDPILDTGIEAVETSKNTMEVESKKKVTNARNRPKTYPPHFITRRADARSNLPINGEDSA